MESYKKLSDDYNDSVAGFQNKDAKEQYNAGIQLIENAFRQNNRYYEEGLLRMNAENEDLKSKLALNQNIIKKQDAEIKELQNTIQKLKEDLIKVKKINSILQAKCDRLDNVRKTILTNLQDMKSDDLDSHSVNYDNNYGTSIRNNVNVHSMNESNGRLSPTGNIHSPSRKPELASSIVDIRTRELFKLAKAIMHPNDFAQFISLVQDMNLGKTPLNNAINKVEEILCPKYNEICKEFKECVKLKSSMNGITI